MNLMDNLLAGGHYNRASLSPSVQGLAGTVIKGYYNCVKNSS